jgi:hypothetical protein
MPVTGWMKLRIECLFVPLYRAPDERHIDGRNAQLDASCPGVTGDDPEKFFLDVEPFSAGDLANLLDVEPRGKSHPVASHREEAMPAERLAVERQGALSPAPREGAGCAA